MVYEIYKLAYWPLLTAKRLNSTDFIKDGGYKTESDTIGGIREYNEASGKTKLALLPLKCTKFWLYSYKTENKANVDLTYNGVSKRVEVVTTHEIKREDSVLIYESDEFEFNNITLTLATDNILMLCFVYFEEEHQPEITPIPISVGLTQMTYSGTIDESLSVSETTEESSSVSETATKTTDESSSITESATEITEEPLSIAETATETIDEPSSVSEAATETSDHPSSAFGMTEKSSTFSDTTEKPSAITEIIIETNHESFTTIDSMTEINIEEAITESPSSSIPIGMIVGIVFAIIAAILITFIIIIFIIKSKKKNAQNNENDDQTKKSSSDNETKLNVFQCFANHYYCIYLVLSPTSLGCIYYQDHYSSFAPEE